MKRQDFKHIYKETVRWGDCDLLGHVNNTVYLRFIESGRLDYFLNVLGIELKPDSTEGFVMADIKGNFLGQVHYPCELEVATRFTRVGKSSVIVASDIFKAGTDEAVFTSTCTSVWCDYTQSKSAPFPDALRAKVKAFEGNVEGL